MTRVDIALFVFAICNGLRVLAYLPQIAMIQRDRAGATTISCTTWTLFAAAHFSSMGYAISISADWRMAAVFGLNGAFCLIILALVFGKRRSVRAGNARLRQVNPVAISIESSENA